MWNTWTALGAVGDVGEKAFKIPKVVELLNKEGLAREEVLKVIELIDSNYIAMDRKGVEQAVKVVLENSEKDLLTHKPWIKRAKAVGDAIQDALSNVEVRDGIAYITFESPFNIISKVARKAVWELGYDGALAVNGNFHEKLKCTSESLLISLKRSICIKSFLNSGKRTSMRVVKRRFWVVFVRGIELKRFWGLLTVI